MAAGDTIAAFVLEALDTLFFRDGRAFDAGARATSGLPAPQTLAGALRTWLLAAAGCDFDRLAEAVRAGRSPEAAAAEQGEAIGGVFALAVRGPWLARDGSPLVPAPGVLQRPDGSSELVRLVPLRKAPPGWEPPLPGMSPLWLTKPGKAEPVAGYVTLDGLAAFLRGGVPTPDQIVAAGDLYDHDYRTGITIDGDSLTTREGLIYGAGMLALRKGVSFYAEVGGWTAALDRLAPPQGDSLIRWGGEGRHARVRRLPKPVAWPRVEPDPARAEKPLIMLTSPGLFDATWRPSWLDPLAAAVPGAVAVSGWDLARGGPKPTRFAAAAGSTYYLSKPATTPAIPGSLCGAEDARAGWGTYVEGAWTYG